MNDLFNKADASGILERLEKLTPTTQGQWGKMDVGQMLAHCTSSLETAMGKNFPKKLPLLLRLIGAMMKPGIVGEKSLPKNSATDKLYIITDHRDFETERTNLIQQVRAFSEGGPSGCTSHKHVFFGTLSPEQWATMQWKHFDHHLRQFGIEG